METFETGYAAKRAKLSSPVAYVDLEIPKEIASFLGMVIPLNAEPSYINTNFKDYKQVLSRKKNFQKISFSQFIDLAKFNDRYCLDYLKSLKDQEIFDLLGIKVGYRSRQELVSLSLQALTKRTFFLPNIPSDSDRKNHIVGFGTVTDSQVYDLTKTTKAFLIKLCVSDLSSLALLLETFVFDE